MIAIIVGIVAFVGIFFAPLLMGPLEVIRRRDAAALPLTVSYVREPRFFARSFRETLAPLVDGSAPRRVLHRVDDVVRIVDRLDYGPRTTDADVVVVRGDAVYPEAMTVRDHYVRGDARGGERLRARAILVDGTAVFGSGLRIRRWIDAEQALVVAGGSNLGQSASSAGPVTLAGGVRFSRVFGNPVRVAAEGIQLPAPPRLSRPQTVAPASVHDGDLIARGDLRIGADAQVHGSIKCHGRLVLEARAVVDGSAVVRGNAYVADGACVTGHLFSESSIVLGADTLVAAEGARKSVYAARHVLLGPRAVVWGWILAERGGRTARV
jgi:predicted acyltransferase (DUF342 family)